MSSRISLWVGLIGVAATIPLVQTVAVAKSSVEMHRIGKAITVLITSNDGQGSGVILQHQGDIYTVLTAAHVVRKKVNYKITTPDERQYEVISDSIQTSPGDIDLAVVKFKATTKYTTAKLGNCNTIEGGMDLYVTGFPAPDEVITATTLVVREGKVTANSNKTFANGYSLIYSNDTLRGMSGGAVLNNEGELVAIHGKGDRNKDKDGENAEKNGYNVGISINRFQTVASRMGVELNGQVAALSQDRTPKADDYLISGIEKSVTGNPQGALADFNRAIALNPNFDKAYQERGFLKYSKLKDTQGALADYNRAIQLNPNYLEAYYTRGLLKDYKNDPQGALADYNRAIQINPNDFKAYNARARLKTDKLNDTLGSLADYQRVIQLQPTISSGYEGRGLLRDNKLNDPQGALADYDRAVKLNPSFINNYENRGLLKADKLNDLQGALADFNVVIRSFPNSYGSYLCRGMVKYYMLNDPEGALAEFNRAIQISPNDANAYRYRGNLKQNKLNNIPGALADFDRSIQINPDEAIAYHNRGILKKDKFNDLQGALVDFDRAIQLKPNFAGAYGNRGLLKYYKLRDRAGAINDLQQAAMLFQQQKNQKSYQQTIDLLKKWQQTSRPVASII